MDALRWPMRLDTEHSAELNNKGTDRYAGRDLKVKRGTKEQLTYVYMSRIIEDRLSEKMMRSGKKERLKGWMVNRRGRNK